MLVFLALAFAARHHQHQYNAVTFLLKVKIVLLFSIHTSVLFVGDMLLLLGLVVKELS